MSDPRINLGAHTLNAPERHDPRTAVVLGLPRSGTTMIATVLHHLGIPMGDDLTDVMEDRPLSRAVEDSDLDSVRQIVTDRNERYDVWGWKRPSSRNHLDTIQAEMRNPYYIAVLRDPIACATRKNLSVGSDVIHTMRSHVNAQRHLIRVIADLAAPLLLLSYEKSLVHPRDSVEAIAAFVGVAVTDEAVSCVQPDAPDYVEATRPTKTHPFR